MALRFTVGQLAQLCQLSKQTLIYYDRQGVFSPKEIDPNNGYRYYTADQLEVLDSILILKEIGLSLAEIRSFMAARSTEHALSMLRQQQGRLHEKIAALSLVARRLAHKIQTLEQVNTESSAPRWIYLPQSQPLFVQPVAPPGGLLEVDFAVAALFRTAQRGNALHFYQVGTMIGGSDLQAGRYLTASYAFFPLDVGEKTGSAPQRPSGWHLHSVHRGAYESIGRTYKEMLALVEKQGCRLSDYSYEYCVLDSLTTKASRDYVTEIYLPVSGGDFPLDAAE